MNTEVFTWKPNDWGRNHGSFTNSKIYFASFNLGWGNNPLQFYFTSLMLKGARTLIYSDFPAATGRGYNPYKPTV